MGKKIESLKNPERDRKKVTFYLSVKDQDRNGLGEGTVTYG